MCCRSDESIARFKFGTGSCFNFYPMEDHLQVVPKTVAPEKVKGSEVQNGLQSLRLVYLMTVKPFEVPATVSAGNLSYTKGLECLPMSRPA